MGTVQHSPRSAGKIDKALGARIRVRRTELGLSQKQLGEAVGVTFQQIQKYERGRNRVGVSRLQHIAEALKVPIGFFFHASSKEREVERMISLDPVFSLRLLRAYEKVGNVKLKRKFVRELERVAEIE